MFRWPIPWGLRRENRLARPWLLGVGRVQLGLVDELEQVGLRDAVDVLVELLE